MRLKKLELFGFKSFGKKIELVFTTPISIIVGPNGSGKSNIAEAMRFVLGEQSLKSMRGKRGEDMIWNGSTGVMRAGRASVTVIFDNADRVFTTIDFDEVIIKRVVYRDGINEYFINDSRVRLKDIIEILSSVHIGASSHHIISQGEADRILSASITERRSMVEDALGLKIYHYKKTESEKKLKKTDENIKEVNILRKELGPHIKFLKKQVERIEKARAMRIELSEKYKEYFKYESQYLAVAREQISKDGSIPEARVKEIEKELAAARAALHNKENGNKTLEEIMEVERQLYALQNKKDKDSRELGRLEGMLEYEKKISERRELKEKQISFSDVRQMSENLYDKIEILEASDDIVSIKENLRSLRRILSDFIARYRSDEHTDAFGVISRGFAELEEKISYVKKDIETVRAKETDRRTHIETLRRTLEQSKDRMRESEKKLFELMSEETRARAELSEVSARRNALSKDEEAFKRELGEAVAIVGRTAIEFQDNIKENSLANSLAESRDAQYERLRAIEKLKIRLEEYGGGAGEEIVKEYEDIAERDQFLARELEDLEKTAESLREMIADLENRLNSEFKEGVNKINLQFQEFFSLLFDGGTASLAVLKKQKRKRIDAELDDSDLALLEEEPETQEGLEIEVSLPRKKIRGLQMLSGGERALTSIALLFSLSQVNPPPFMVLDETDAALDEANSEKYGMMIKTLSQKSQLVVITHNRGTMAYAGVLYGVTMGSDGVSKLLSIKFDDVAKVA